MKLFKYTSNGGRESNQDYIAVSTHVDERFAAILADGMGGYSNGDIAAQTVANDIAACWQSATNDSDTEKVIIDAFRHANSVLKQKRSKSGMEKMGCVVASLFKKDNRLLCAWIGDSRICHFRNGTLLFRSQDHSLISEISKKRTVTPSDIERYSSVVTQAIMGDDSPSTPSIKELSFQPGDIIVLCTDGFHKSFDINIACKYDENEKEKIDLLTSKANDNVSFIKIEL
ncbi:MAG: serine/threonine-protein phosphatase [Bacteroidales bacterium]|nr:serine/threonine-protein phosphatase [Bacteroidales bacterium]